MLETIANFAQILGGIAVFVAVIFAVIQIRQYYQQRSDAAAVELMRTFRTQQLIESYHLMGSISDGISDAELRAKGAEYEVAGFTVIGILESIGLLVFQGVAPFHTVQELIGGTVLSMWRKLHVWVEELRQERNNERIAEWFQWLAERFKEHEEKIPTQPAYKKFVAWKPRRRNHRFTK